MKNYKPFKLQVPMDRSLYDAIARQADAMGFDSAQAYVRFWANSLLVKGEKQGSIYETQVLKYIDLTLAVNQKPFKSTDEVMDYLMRKFMRVINRYAFREMLRDLDPYDG